jgi:DNA-binding NtrC family response regulator
MDLDARSRICLAQGGPLVRYDVAGFPEDEALSLLCGSGRRAGVAEAADGGTILVEEAARLPAQAQAVLLRLLKTGRCERRGAAMVDDDDGASAGAGARARAEQARNKRFDVRVVAMSDRDLPAEVAAGRFRHDLYYRLARIQLSLPPLRERKEDIGPAVIWMGNRILREARVPLELMGKADFDQAPRKEQLRAVAVHPEAIRALEQHAWPGNFRELEAVLERALLLYRRGSELGAGEIAAALGG